MYSFKQHSQSVTVDKSKELHCYGAYIRNGIKSYRNYHRELKNGKGLSILDLLLINIEKAEKKMRKTMTEDLYK